MAKWGFMMTATMNDSMLYSIALFYGFSATFFCFADTKEER